MTTFAPSSMGFIIQGVLNVASITRGMPAALVILAIAGTSKISMPGLPITSPNTILVFVRIASAMAVGLFGGTKVVSMP